MQSRGTTRGSTSPSFIPLYENVATAVQMTSLKLGLAAACFVWYVIGNHPTLGWHRDKYLLAIFLVVLVVNIATGFGTFLN